MLAAIFANVPAIASAMPDTGTACPGLFAGGVPPALIGVSPAGPGTLLCSDSFAVLSSPVTRGPLWGAEDLTEENLEIAGSTSRTGTFHPEWRLPAYQTGALEDWRGSGYDRGHVVPSGDEAGRIDQEQSFALSNVVPQTAELNRGAWEGVEAAVRGLARDEGEIFVVTGPGYDPDSTVTIGPDRLPVPAVFWKAIYDPARQGTGAYVCLNTDHPTCRITTVSTLEQLVNIDPFPALPSAIKTVVMAMPPIRESPYALAARGHEGMARAFAYHRARQVLGALARALAPR